MQYKRHYEFSGINADGEACYDEVVTAGVISPRRPGDTGMSETLEDVIYGVVTGTEKFKSITFPIDPDNDEMEMKVEWEDGSTSWWYLDRNSCWVLREPFVASLTE